MVGISGILKNLNIIVFKEYTFDRCINSDKWKLKKPEF